MKKLLTILFLFITLEALCPPDGIMKIPTASPVMPYERLYQAVCQVESGNNPFAVNEKEHSYGISQIRQIRLDHYAKLTGKVYTLQDCFDKEVSKEIFMTFAQMIKDEERICKSWNAGMSGINKASAERYWQKVRNHL